MGKDSGIQWTHHTFNPWWGCEKVSPGCTNCYAAAFDKRVGGMNWGKAAPRRFFGEKHWNNPRIWDAAAAKAGERHRVFCASMADVFEDRPDLVDHRVRLFNLIQVTPNLDWLLLTKRPENVVRMLGECRYRVEGGIRSTLGLVPMTNVWLGTTVENQEQAERRIPELLWIPAAVRFLSMEPLLGPVDLTALGVGGQEGLTDALTGVRERSGSIREDGDAIDWVIVGGESGPKARPFDLAWARFIRDQCEVVGVACFVKQLGARPVDDESLAGGKAIDRLKDKHGGDWDEWPADLRVREFPKSVAAAATSDCPGLF
jgi:protein gp37